MDAVSTLDLDVRFREMKRYVRFGADDVRALAAFRERAQPHFPHIVELFYERVREHEEAFQVFGDEQALERMHRLLAGWLERLLTGPYDAAYAQRSCNIGRLHVRVGMPQRFMFTAMSVFRQGLHAVADAETDAPIRLAIDRILDLELALMNDAYREAMVERIKRLEREARTRAERTPEARRFERAFAMAQCIALALDARGRVVIANRSAAELLDSEANDVVGEAFERFVAEDREVFRSTLAEVLLAKERIGLPLTLSLTTRTGRIRRFEGSLVRDPEDEDETFVLLSGEDVTEEEALLARVRQAERLAAVGTLAAGLAHEIRNPLNGAQLHITYIERALRRRGGDRDLEDAIGIVSGEIARLSALVNEFLDFARPAKPDTKPVDIKALCRHAANISRSETTGVDVAVELPHSPLVASVDPHKIEQVVLNLVRNAVEACEPTSGHVRIRAFREPRFAVVEVVDDGPGFPEDAPIFDAFFSTKAQGTGMGLAIAHRIVDEHGGSIQAERLPGATVFRVRLPIAVAAQQE